MPESVKGSQLWLTPVQTSAFVQSQDAEVISVDKWNAPSLPVYINRVKARTYAYPENAVWYPITPAPAPPVFPDSWRQIFRANPIHWWHRPHLYPTNVKDLLPRTEDTTVDRWVTASFDLPRRRPDTQWYKGKPYFYDPFPLGSPEVISVDKWFRPLGTPRWDLRREQFLASTFIYTPAEIPLSVNLDSWLTQWFDFPRQRGLYTFLLPVDGSNNFDFSSLVPPYVHSGGPGPIHDRIVILVC